VNPMMKFAPFLIVAIMLCAFLWSVDFITLQGEWTVYTAECKQGTWNQDQCLGKLVASDRYRFRTLKRRKEVLFWIPGSDEPSGRLTPCEVENRSNWTCSSGADSPRSITLTMNKGRPVSDPAANTRPFHAVSKIRWMLLKYASSAQ
jgi:hypothetical protein